jgi:hypothetical protein
MIEEMLQNNSAVHRLFIDLRLITKFYSDDQIKKNEVGGARSRYRGEARRIEDLGRNPGEKKEPCKT